MSPSQFDPNQRLHQLHDLASASILTCRSMLLPTQEEMLAPELKCLLNPAEVRSCPVEFIPPQLAAREFAFELNGVAEPLARILNGKKSLPEQIEVAIGIGNSYFPENRQAAELFSQVVLHKLVGDTATPYGLDLINSKLLMIMDLVGPEKLRLCLENGESEIARSRRLFDGKLSTVEDFLAQQFAAGKRALICSIESDVKIRALGDSLLSALPKLKAAGITHFGIPDFSAGIGRGYYPSDQFKKESAELARLLQSHDMGVVSTHVATVDFRNIHQSVADHLEQRLIGLPEGSRAVAFTEPEQVYRCEKRHYYCGDATPLAFRLEQLWGAGSVCTMRWVRAEETLKGHAAVGRNASRGVRASDILSLAHGEFCIAPKDVGDPILSEIIRPHNGLETDAILLEG